MSLVSQFGKYDRKLKKYCKEQMKNGDKSISAVWVCDNYRLCSSPLKAAVRFLSSEGEKDLEPLFLLCKDLFSSGKEISVSRIAAKLSSERLSISQCEALSILLFAAGSAVICDNLYGDDGEIVPSCVRNLIKLTETDIDSVIYDISIAERMLCDDPAEIYEKMSPETKRLYRKAVVKGAKNKGKSETEYLRDVLARAKGAEEGEKHIGFYLPVISVKPLAGKLFIAGEWMLSLVISIFISIQYLGNVFFMFPLLLPVYAAVKPLTDRLSAFIFPPLSLPKMSEDHIHEGNTLITVSTLVPSASKAGDMSAHLSALYSSNSLSGVKVMLLADMRNSKTPETVSDKTDIQALKRLTDELNEKHGGGFLLAVRDRVYSPFENEYTGFERKRGAICALIKYLRDRNCDVFSTVYGDTVGVEDMKYILALDSDTELSFESLRKLVCAAEHPLNKPRYDAMKKRIISGYGIFSPRTETSRESGEKSIFARIFTNSGSVSYSPNVHERYSDMFSRGIFCGKGLINIDAFNEVCADGFEEHRILSHDILEGAVMGTAFVSDCGFTDSFPSTPDGYFMRSHRWIRGDVQNLRYIFRPLGKKETAPEIPALGKYQLADNFRRAVTPVNVFLLMVLSCFLPHPFRNIFIFISAGAVIAEYLFPVLMSFLSGGLKVFSTLYFSSELSSAHKDILRAVLSLGSLPQTAFTCCDAVLKGAYRSLVSKKHLLQWTTAADGDFTSGKNIFRNILFPLMCIAVFFVYGTYLHRLFAVFILVFIPFGLFRGIRVSTPLKKELTENESSILTSFAAAAWRFFSENVIAAENYLPPDNIQETPVPRRAARTSPTNIGMYLVSVLAAADLSFITAREMFSRLDDTLTSVENLPKYNGLLYNWYDTKKMVPLSPAYVSAVDCGNYLVCLTALKQGLLEYEKFSPTAVRLSDRIEKLLGESDLSVLYDKTRDLFRIGLECETGKLSRSFYDLYMSEARMTSYYECARRHVPARHWSTLDRTLKRTSGYIAAASWTGTMFEYFMPSLFLDTLPGTFQYEALKVCLYLQKKSARKKNIPYGVSESCFYAVDNSLNYKYKAHGIRTLALKRDADDESVVSPYSVFLTLPFDKASAVKALSRLSALHCEGSCGFYEAVDFTKDRTDGEHYSVVRCYMSHHVGMSIIALANTLLDDVFVKRFMSDPDMASARSLLCEKIPDHPRVTKFPGEGAAFEDNDKKTFADGRSAPEEGKEAYAYSNGDITLFCDKYGRNRCVFSSQEIYKYSRRSEGISVGVDAGDGIIPMFPLRENEVGLKKYALITKKKTDNADITAGLCVHPSENAVLIPVKIVNNSKKARSFRIFYYLEPSLLPFGREDPHPAFSDMFLGADEDEKNRLLVFSRNNREGAPFISVGFCGRNRLHYSLDRESVLERNADRKSVFENGFSVEDKKPRGINPVAAVFGDVHIAAGGKCECVLAVCVGSSRMQSVHTLLSLRNTQLPDITKGAAATFLRDKITFPEVSNFISRVCFGGEYSEKAKAAAEVTDGGISSLWKTGISGDRPLITVFPDSSCPSQLQRAYIKLYKRLAKCSVPADLVFIFRDSSEYGFNGEKELLRIIEAEGVSDALANKDGIYIFYGSLLPDDSFAAILSHSAVIYPDEYKKSVPCFYPAFDAEKMQPATDGENRFTGKGYLINQHPSLPWSHTLANSVFGTLVTDRSLGYTWALNSRQNKLTAWSNDTASDLTGERLFIRADGTLLDPISDAGVYFNENSAVYFSQARDILCAVNVSVPKKGMFKKITVTLKNESDKALDAEIIYCVSPVLGENRENSRILQINRAKNGYVIKNPMNEDHRGVMYLTCSGENTDFYKKPPMLPDNVYVMPTLLQKIVVGANEKISADFYMSFAVSENAAIECVQTAFSEKQKKNIQINTGYGAFDEFANALLYHQTADTRLRARCGFYQCSGAFGFRDQLQDVLPLIGLDNSKVRQMIFKAASAQFPEGDVLHWFHPIYKNRLIYKGVRSRCSDDKLWLAYVVAAYVNKTGDRDILFRKIPFLAGEKLKNEEDQHYGEYVFSDTGGTLYHHCIYAIADAMKTGAHNLPLIGNGDWNDSFDSVGEKGLGESVWLAMFMIKTCKEFAKICDSIEDDKMKNHLESTADALAAAVEKYAWNGKWYIRGFYDDGDALGDEGAQSCETDILCQAWASLADMPDKNRVRAALGNAYERLFDEKSGTVSLFSPPFSQKSKKTGYVNFYPEGMRENGGQYTHAAVWFLIALFKEGMKAEAERVLYALLPSEKYKNGFGEIYKSEPYALAGDVYTARGFEGRGGWSLYTGSAGWLLQLARLLTENNLYGTDIGI